MIPQTGKQARCGPAECPSGSREGGLSARALPPPRAAAERDVVRHAALPAQRTGSPCVESNLSSQGRKILLWRWCSIFVRTCLRAHMPSSSQAGNQDPHGMGRRDNGRDVREGGETQRKKAIDYRGSPVVCKKPCGARHSQARNHAGGLLRLSCLEKERLFRQGPL